MSAQAKAIESVRKDLTSSGQALLNNYDQHISNLQDQMALMEGPNFAAEVNGKVTFGAQAGVDVKLGGIGQINLEANFVSMELVSGSAGFNPNGNSPDAFDATGSYINKGGITKYEQGAAAELKIKPFGDVGVGANFKQYITDRGDGSPTFNSQVNYTVGVPVLKHKNDKDFKNGPFSMPGTFAAPNLKARTANTEKKFFGIDLSGKAAAIIGLEGNFKLGFYYNAPKQ